MKELLEHLVSPATRKLRPYHVPPSDGLIKLDAMENPYTLPSELRGGVAGVPCGGECQPLPRPRGPSTQATYPGGVRCTLTL